LTKIDYNIVIRPRRKTASIVIKVNNEIDVLVPSCMPAKHIEQFVLSKSKWIDKKLHFNEKIRLQHSPKEFVTGETFNFLGKLFQLKVTHENNGPILLNNNDLIIHVSSRLTEEKQKRFIRKKLFDWYREQAEQHFSERALHFSKRIGKAPTLTSIKNYKSRWGSCHHNGRIFFNWRLIMAPEWIIDYVVVHELCHLVHHNHSPAFWQLVEAIAPDYRNAKTWLKINGLTLEL
jgi:predicted metal-dependent hydrolase